MRITILKDKTIPQNEYDELTSEYKAWYQRIADITPVFFTEEMDYTDYPTYTQGNGLVRPNTTWFEELTADIKRRYTEYGTDHVVLLIHEDNWKSDGIWGTSYANMFNGFQLQYCRWDGYGDNRIVNSFGTLYHEIHHNHDSFVKTYTGVDIEKILKVGDWDNEITHGNSLDWEYIRYRENRQSISRIKKHLQEAYAKRQALYDQKVGTMKKTISLLQQILILLRKLNNKKHTQTK